MEFTANKYLNEICLIIGEICESDKFAQIARCLNIHSIALVIFSVRAKDFS